jgi:hypothetical protein
LSVSLCFSCAAIYLLLAMVASSLVDNATRDPAVATISDADVLPKGTHYWNGRAAQDFGGNAHPPAWDLAGSCILKKATARCTFITTASLQAAYQPSMR